MCVTLSSSDQESVLEFVIYVYEFHGLILSSSQTSRPDFIITTDQNFLREHVIAGPASWAELLNWPVRRTMRW